LCKQCTQLAFDSDIDIEEQWEIVFLFINMINSPSYFGQKATCLLTDFMAWHEQENGPLTVILAARLLVGAMDSLSKVPFVHVEQDYEDLKLLLLCLPKL
jgi:hypothetical protein